MTTNPQSAPCPEPDDSLDKALFAAFEDEDGPHAITGATRSTLRALGRVSRSVRLVDPDDGPPAGGVADDDGTIDSDTDSGRYAVSGEVGRGGIGVVLKARDVDLGRDVAIKVLKKQFLDDEQMVARFVEEAQIGGQLEHPGIVPVHELGLHADQRPYMAMKLVRGRTLASLLKDRPAVDADRRRFLSIFEKVVDTIAYAHARGVIHRDLKPANVMVGAFGEIQVMDWGMAKVLYHQDDRADASAGDTAGDSGILVRCAPPERSRAGSVMGTPAYMAPEQARGEVEELDARSDVFALGAILCEVLTGAPPFGGKGATAARDQAAKARLDPALARLAVSGADAELVRIARHCLAAEQAARPADARAVGDRLRAYLSAVDERVRAAQIAAAEARVKAREERKARRLTVGLAATVLLALLIAGVSYFWIDGNRRARVARATAAVNRALEEVAEFQGEARAAPVGELSAWEKVYAALGRAGAVAAQRDVEPAVQARLTAVEATVEQEEARAVAAAQQADRDERMVRRLDHIFHEFSYRVSAERRAAIYREAFRDYGIDVPNLDDESVVQRVRTSAVQAELIAALDDWANALRRTDKALQHRILSIALAADPDAFRSEVRRAILDEDVSGLTLLTARKGVEANDPRTLVVVAKTLGDAGETNAATALLLRAWECRPGEPAFPTILHDLLLRTRPPRAEEALSFARVAMSQRPGSARLRTNYAVVLSANGMHDEAIRAAQRALEFDSRSCPAAYIAYLTLANELRAKKEYAEAERAARKAVALNPAGSSAHYTLGEILRLAGRSEDALAEFRILLRDHPKVGAAHCARGKVLLAMKRLDEAREAFQSALENVPFPDHLGSGSTSIVTASESDKVRAWALLGLGEIHRRRGEFEQVFERVEEALRIRPDYVYGLQILAATHGGRGDLEKSVELYRKVVGIDPDNWQARLELARLSPDRDERKRCLELLGARARRDPGNVNLLMRLGDFHLKRSDFDAAARHLRAAANAAPDNPKVLVALAGALAGAGRLKDAHRAIDQVLQRWPDLAIAHAQLGAILVQARRFDRAIECFEAAIARDPDLATAHRNLGYVLFQQGRYREAVPAYQRCVALSPREAGAHLFLAVSLAKTDATEEALTAYRACLELDPRCVPAMHGLGALLFSKRDDVVGAINIFAKALQLKPDDHAILCDLGVAYCSVGLYREAVEALENAVRLKPTLPKAWKLLGDSLSLSQLDWARAAQAYERALQLRLSDRMTLLKLGALYEFEGRWKEALRAYRGAGRRGARQPVKNEAGTPARVEERASHALSELQHMLELADRVDEHLANSGAALSPADRSLLARVCYAKKDFASAARLFASAFEAEPSLADRADLRLLAARAAGRALSEGRRGSGSASADDLTTWCRQALAWMGAALEAKETRAQTEDKKTRRTVLRQLRAWRISPYLEAVRSEAALGDLPPAEQKQCREFWARVDALTAELDPDHSTEPKEGG